MANGPLAAVVRHIRQWVGVETRASQTDGQLLEEFVRRREEDAFAALVERHAPLVFGVCRRMLNQEADAEDAFQATFLVFARRAASIRRQQSLPAWLYGVARRVSLKARQQAARRESASQRAMDVTPNMAGPDTSEQVVQREASQLLDEELQHLPEKYRLPLILCYFHGRTYEEAAQELGLPAGSMGKRLHQAQDRLRERLQRRGVTLGSAGLAALLASSAQAVSPILIGAATRAGFVFAAGNLASLTVSERVLGLAEAVLQSLWLSKVKGLAVAGAVLVLLMGGSTAFMIHSLAKPEPEQFVSVPLANVQIDEPEVPKSWQERWTTSWKGEMVSCLALAPNGKTVAIARQDGTISLLDAGSGKVTGTLGKKIEAAVPGGFPGAGVGGFGGGVGMGGFGGGGMAGFSNVTCLAFSADGKTLVSAGNGPNIELWDVATQKSRLQLPTGEGNTHFVPAVAMAPDGKSVVAAGSNVDGQQSAGWLKQWNLQSKQVVSEYQGGAFTSIGTLSFAPHGKAVAFGEMTIGGRQFNLMPASVVKLFDLKTQKVTWQSKAEDQLPVTLIPDPAGKVLALTRSDGAIEVWDAKKEAFVSRFKIEQMGGRMLFSPDGRQLATLHQDVDQGMNLLEGKTTIWLLDGETGKRNHTVALPQAFSPQLLAFSGDGQTLALGGMRFEQPDQALPQDPNAFGGPGQPFAPGIGGFPQPNQAGGAMVGGFGFGGGIVGEVRLLNLKAISAAKK